MLMVSTTNGHIQLVNILLKESNINVNAKNKDGDTALQYAKKYGHQIIAVKLKQFIAAEKLIKKTLVTKIINFFSNIKKWIVGTVVTSEQNKSSIIIKSSILTSEN